MKNIDYAEVVGIVVFAVIFIGLLYLFAEGNRRVRIEDEEHKFMIQCTLAGHTDCKEKTEYLYKEGVFK